MFAAATRVRARFQHCLFGWIFQMRGARLTRSHRIRFYVCLDRAPGRRCKKGLGGVFKPLGL